MTLQTKKIGFIGAGAMAEAILSGIISAGLFPAERIFAVDVNQDRLNYICSSYGINSCPNIGELISRADIVVFAVKPQVIKGVLHESAGYVTGGKLVVSIAAGIELRTIESALPGGVPVIRVLPNTPCLVGAGISAITLGKYALPEHEQQVLEIFRAIGTAFTVAEPMMDAVTGLSGSGPAYIYLVIEALADGGVKAGLAREQAIQLAAGTVFGAAKMVLETKKHPAVLKDMVASPAGTTIAALHVLEEKGMRAAMIDAVMAAVTRSKELREM